MDAVSGWVTSGGEGLFRVLEEGVGKPPGLNRPSCLARPTTQDGVKVPGVTNDKLLLTLLLGNPQLQDPNPDPWQAGSQKILGLKPEWDSTLENLLRLDEQKLLASGPSMPRVPVNLANESLGQAKDPELTWATAVRGAKKLPAEWRPPKDDRSHNLEGKLALSWFKPANQITPTMDPPRAVKT
ncbi:hypothetical protein DSO57_1038264 [Entomophthora muscae]|uniref:Uncharacterized protein n=1 Tax=Entomophthora muscae TaxID=34485 RepID=A0ACC2SBG4_9FUNG|nr:hypothetical protein DSO57_1038264 [Entomophthora muscae]